MAEQVEIPGTERKKIPAIERAAARADDKRSVIGGLQDELDNLVAKLSEVMHGNEDSLDSEENDKGERVLIYKRGDFNIVVAFKESIKYKIKKSSKGDELDEE